MKTIRLLLLAVIGSAGWFFTLPPSAQAHPATLQVSEECQELVTRYEHNDALLATLIDPLLTTLEEVDHVSQIVQGLHDCLAQTPDGQLNDKQLMLLRLADYFLIFVTNSENAQGDTRLELVDLRLSDDPSILHMREQAKVPAPEGYVYLRYYPSRAAMPEIIQRAFTNPDVAGVTILTRYIAVLDEPANSWAENALKSQVLPKTISHELVHTYINASLGPYHFNSLPSWYHEGLAVYFSGSGDSHTVITPNYTITETTSQQYKQFELIFKYLQNRLGDEQLHQVLRKSLESYSTAPLYEVLGLESENWLFQAARAWQAQRQRVGFLAVFALAVAAGIGLYSLAPEYACECGHTGRRRDFPGGVCPECSRRLPNVRYIPWLPNLFYAGCQVCGRRFWRWQFGELHFQRWRIKAWRPALAEQPPQFVWVHRICDNCSQISQSTYQSLAERMQTEVDTARTQAVLIYQTWLSQAPFRAYNSFARQDSLQMPKALDLFVRLALQARYPDWVEESLSLQFVPDPQVDFTQRPPEGYANIVTRTIIQDDENVTLLGSLGRLNNAIVLIEWKIQRSDAAPAQPSLPDSGNQMPD